MDERNTHDDYGMEEWNTHDDCYNPLPANPKNQKRKIGKKKNIIIVIIGLIFAAVSVPVVALINYLSNKNPDTTKEEQFWFIDPNNDSKKEEAKVNPAPAKLAVKEKKENQATNLTAYSNFNYSYGSNQNLLSKLLNKETKNVSTSTATMNVKYDNNTSEVSPSNLAPEENLTDSTNELVR